MSEVTDEAMSALSDSTPRWLIFPQRPRASGPLADYLKLGEDEYKVKDRHLVQLRLKAKRPWYQVEAEFEAPIVMTYMNKSGVRFVRNLIGAVPLNNWLAISPRDGVDIDELLSVLRRPTVARSLREHAREYGNGLWKVEPSELAALRLPKLCVSATPRRPVPRGSEDLSAVSSLGLDSSH